PVPHHRGAAADRLGHPGVLLALPAPGHRDPAPGRGARDRGHHRLDQGPQDGRGRAGGPQPSRASVPWCPARAGSGHAAPVTRTVRGEGPRRTDSPPRRQPEPAPQRLVTVLRRLVAVLRRHWLITVLLLAGLLLRVAALIAYRPILFYIDSTKYLYHG